MKKGIIFALLMALALTGCSRRLSEARMQENWIHYENVESVMKNKTKKFLLEELGSPVLVELEKDTVFYVYNYRAALYQAERKVVKKPKESDRNDQWLPASRMYVFKVLNNQVVEGSFYDAEPQPAGMRGPKKLTALLK